MHVLDCPCRAACACRVSLLTYSRSLWLPYHIAAKCGWVKALDEYLLRLRAVLSVADINAKPLIYDLE